MKKTILNRILKIIRTILPWMVAAGLFYYLFQKVPPKKVLESLTYVRPLLFFAFALFYFLTILTLDTWGLSKVISKFSLPVSFPIKLFLLAPTSTR